MLKKIAESGLEEHSQFGALFIHRVDAVCLETQAVLIHSGGRGKYGLLKYFLLVPHRLMADPENNLIKDGARWRMNHGSTRSVVRAWTFEEALEVANKRLPKIVKRIPQPVSD